MLLEQADKQLERQGRRIETLKARADLQTVRLSHPERDASDERPPSSSGKDRSKPGTCGTADGSAKQRLDGEAALKAKAMRQRKEALKYGVERLELEVLQKERELRIRLDNV